MSTKVKGVAASKGIKVAKAYKLEELDLSFEEQKNVDIEDELKKLDQALKVSEEQLDEIKKVAEAKLGEDEAEVFEAHKLMLNDPEIQSAIKASIQNEKKDVATSIVEQTDNFIALFENMDNEYFKGRAADIKDVRQRLLANILGKKLPNLATIQEEVIIIAKDLTPSQTSQLNKKITLGFATNIGGRTSHGAILARSLEIPAIVGTGDILEQVKDNDTIILDAIDGIITINPSEEELKEAEEKIENYKKELEILKEYKNKESLTKDGHEVKIVSNIGSPDDLPGVIENGSEGVGLYRTEFLYIQNDHLPTEEEQFEAYKAVLEGVNGGPVVVRTLDIGGDKELPYLKFPEEMNPFLGYRAIRLCLDRTDIFRVQLRALLRASIYGDLHIMFPLISTIDELRAAKEILQEEKENLLKKNVKISDDIKVGMMIEVPSSAVIADLFAKEVDFMSIGTNDLIQYTIAVDRLSEKVLYLYQPYHPAILRLVKNVVDAMEKENKWAGMCGEMASDPIAIVILIGLGLYEFSMSSSAVLPSRMQIAELRRKDVEPHIETILNLSTAGEVEQYVRDHFFKN